MKLYTLKITMITEREMVWSLLMSLRKKTQKEGILLIETLLKY